MYFIFLVANNLLKNCLMANFDDFFLALISFTLPVIYSKLIFLVIFFNNYPEGLVFPDTYII